ncbi:nucleoside-diphosphate-sugar epimerase [Frondihabitans sp. PhB188]|uniref:NAD-dependent epimerase/dehydratase family protein n=1 Tax=Frondihabitans sp. PhB188 TaxID=2485200 RepID=UPI000F470323|nr:NAD(P)-dependent oxidoreductase [Frondihabitans sp. PhB188]ROQ38632.1 nucleoside-diphosphate-sugar epimerase [Frondihabitans sp. PhB188]
MPSPENPVRVAVTGGSGKLGRAVVRDLAEHGYDVVLLDRIPSPEPVPGVQFTRVDLTDFGQVLQSLTAIDDRYDHVDAVVHLGAIPAPGQVPNAALFTNNVTSSYNVFAAAKAAGIRNVVWASSETLLGLPFEVDPPYIPVDEKYAVRPESSYSLGKAVDEEMARHFTRWDPQLKMFGLRFSNVMDDGDYGAFPFDDDAASRSFNLWSYIDARDGALAVRLALESDLTGFEAFVIAASDTVMTTDTAVLAEEFLPHVERRASIEGTMPLLSSDKARDLLGFVPQFSWRGWGERVGR